MPNLREIWNFKPQNYLHWGMLNNSIANFFAILLQCNSKHRERREMGEKRYNFEIYYFIMLIYYFNE